MTFDVVESLTGYIKNTAKPMRWFPIMGLISLWFEARYLMFQSPKKKELEDQLSQAQLLREYYGAKRQEILLFGLATTLAWMLFFSFISLCQQILDRNIILRYDNSAYYTMPYFELTC